jgi:hypothetical protein
MTTNASADAPLTSFQDAAVFCAGGRFLDGCVLSQPERDPNTFSSGAVRTSARHPARTMQRAACAEPTETTGRTTWHRQQR